MAASADGTTNWRIDSGELKKFLDTSGLNILEQDNDIDWQGAQKLRDQA